MSEPRTTLPLVQTLVTLDLETVPDEALVAAVGEPGRAYPEQLQRLVAERRARTGGRSDFLPLPYHRPVVGCLLEATADGGVVSVDDLVVWTDRREPEPAFLELAWRRLEGAHLVSFHGKGFDLPVLELRSLKHAIPTPVWLGSPRRAGAEHHDLRELLAGQGTAAPLDLYAKLVGLPGKDEIDGEDVLALYAAGDLDRIAAYCTTDVVQTYLLFLRWQLVEGSLTPDGYAESVEQAREALPRILGRRLRSPERGALGSFLARCEPFLAAAPPTPARRLHAT